MGGLKIAWRLVSGENGREHEGGCMSSWTYPVQKVGGGWGGGVGGEEGWRQPLLNTRVCQSLCLQLGFRQEEKRSVF